MIFMIVALHSEIRKFITTNIAIFLLALSINLLAWRYKLVSAGITGYSFVLNYVFSIPVGLSLLILNGLILIGNILLLGKNVGGKAVYGYFAFCFAMEATRMVFNISQVSISLGFINQVFFLVLLAALVSIFISVIMVDGYSVGSYSALLGIVSKYIEISASRLFFMAPQQNLWVDFRRNERLVCMFEREVRAG